MHQGIEFRVRSIANRHPKGQAGPTLAGEIFDEAAHLGRSEHGFAHDVAANRGPVAYAGLGDDQISLQSGLRCNVRTQRPRGQYAERVDTARETAAMDVAIRLQRCLHGDPPVLERYDTVIHGVAQRDVPVDLALQVCGGCGVHAKLSR